ncbi:hypothetical protein AXF42_Ash020294 [Apostasia shenzhenica]|uniref:Ubiquitin-like domain-containing protein n=1 Tax=Apostasia shenzhenica TaxID=1088818 RepID=A0A2H9ZSY6_9ASPA|nr:hypothetical protein AXF42_Ash020294 [Apostasia shenzhenica]
MDVIIETADGQRFEQEIWFFSSVLEIKEALHRYHGFPVSRQTLILDGEVMEDDGNTESYLIVQGTRIALRLEPEPGAAQTQAVVKPANAAAAAGSAGKKAKVAVVLPPPGLKRVKVEVNLGDNVSELRKEVQKLTEVNRLRMATDGFFFIFKQRVMDEDRTFRWHDVRPGDVLEMFYGSVTSGA